MMTKSEEQFKKWRAENNFEPFSVNLLDVWNASRQALEIELPKTEKVNGAYDDYTNGFNSGVDACETTIESLGLKVKRDV